MHERLQWEHLSVEQAFFFRAFMQHTGPLLLMTASVGDLLSWAEPAQRERLEECCADHYPDFETSVAAPNRCHW